MRAKGITIAALGVSLALASPGVAADDIEQRLQVMQDRISQLEDELQDTRSQLDTPQAAVAPAAQPASTSEPVAETRSETDSVVAETPPAEDRGAGSALSSFLEATEFSGWVAVSYNYNWLGGFDNTNNEGRNAGRDFSIYPLHPDTHAFSVDQVWFEIDKAVNEDSRSGFHIDLLFGKSAEALGGGQISTIVVPQDLEYAFNNVADDDNVAYLEDYLAATSVTNTNGNGDLAKLFSAYVSYLMPIGTGVQMDFGKLPTLLGAEVAQTPYNFNITRGLVWGLYPVTNVGLVFSGEALPGFSLAAGATNGVYGDSNFEFDDSMAVTGQLSYATDLFSVATGVIWGGPNVAGTDKDDKVGVVDLLVTADPIDNLSLWLNFDFQWMRGDTDASLDSNAYGLALAGRYAINDRWGVALRGEWVRRDPSDELFDASEASYLQALADAGIPTAGVDLWQGATYADFYSITATSDFSLTNHLQIRGEVRYDWTVSELRLCNPPPGLGGNSACISQEPFYWEDDGSLSDRQLVAIIEMIYSF